MALKIITEAGELQGKKILLRVDWNVPVIDGVVVEDFRIRESLKTINYLRESGAKTIIISHFKGELGGSLADVARCVEKILPLSFIQGTDLIEAKTKIEEASAGNIFLLDNIRFHPGEEANDPAFSKNLAALGDIYVNEAFSVSHRRHASIIGVPHYLKSYVGFRFAEEVNKLGRALNPTHPFLFILGGAKFETKEPLIGKFLEIADNIFIGGAVASDLFREEGYEVGDSRVSPQPTNINRQIFSNSKLILPIDITVRTAAGDRLIKKPTEVKPGEKILDAGPETISLLKKKINNATMILWNGPLGNFENGFVEQTEALAEAISKSKAFSIVGGGDTISSIKRLKLEDKFGFLSTAGGAMLEFLATETLPGIEALLTAQSSPR